MTYLELCQRVRQECAITGGNPSPVSVLSQTGVYQKIVTWVNEAWREIQLEKKNWLFMWSPFSFETIVNTSDYTTTSLTVRDFVPEPLVIYKKSLGVADKKTIPYISYDDWYERYSTSNAPATTPSVWTKLPNGTLRFYPTPDDAYVVSGNGQLKVQTLTANTDIPVMPEDYHMAIVWSAAQRWFEDQESSQRKFDVSNNLVSVKSDLLRDQIPAMEWDFGSIA